MQTELQKHAHIQTVSALTTSCWKITTQHHNTIQYNQLPAKKSNQQNIPHPTPPTSPNALSSRWAFAGDFKVNTLAHFGCNEGASAKAKIASWRMAYWERFLFTASGVSADHSCGRLAQRGVSQEDRTQSIVGCIEHN